MVDFPGHVSFLGLVHKLLCVPWSKVAILGMVIPHIPPLIGNPYNGYINPYCWVDDHPYYMEIMGV